MDNNINECIGLLTKEIGNQYKKEDIFDVTGLMKQGTIQGLEIARMILTEYLEENCE